MAPTAAGPRPPRQQRSRASLERVMQAGLAVLQEGGYEAFTIADVSRRARVSVGSMYGRFENKRTLFLSIHRRYVEQMTAEWALDEDEVERLETRELVHRAVDEVVLGFERHGAALRVFMLRAGTDADVYAQAQEGIAAVAQRFKDVLLSRRRDFIHEEPDVAVDVAFHMVFGTAARRVTYGLALESGIEMSWRKLAHEMGTACAAYLIGTA